MKEITRRLYTKPVTIGMALVMGIVLLTGLFVTTKSRAALNYIPADDDRFETTDNGETFHNFAGSPVPAGFFNFDGLSTSEPYAGLVPLEGVPIPGEGNIDTIIRRNQGGYAPFTTTLTMKNLSLESMNPITVTYSDRPSEQWRVGVGLSDFKVSTGSMTILASGIFNSSLNVWPKFTFTRLSDGAQKHLDTGGPGLTASARSAIGGEVIIEPGPEPIPAPGPCRVKVVIDDFEQHAKGGGKVAASTSAAAASSCPPVTLTSTNTPWSFCGGRFCIPFPFPELALLVSHFASPPGTKQGQIR